LHTPVLRKSTPVGRQKKFSFRHFTARAILDSFERHQGATRMEWTTPKHEEIDLNCEISSYANAEL
jgi:phage-related protein